MISKSHIDLNVWSKGGKLLDWFEILRIDRLAYEPMAFTRERLHDSSKIFVEQARCLLLGYSFYPRPNSNALGTAVVVITSGLTITDASTRKTSLIRENKIDWFRSLGCGGFKNFTIQEAYFSPTRSRRRQKETLLARCQLYKLLLYQLSWREGITTQGFTQKGVQPSYGRPSLHKLQGKFT